MEEEAEVEVIYHQGIREGSELISAIDGHAYHKHSVMKGGRLSLRCMYAGNRRSNCKARASVRQDGTGFRPGRVGFHRHPPTLYLLHQRRFRSAVLSECRLPENFTTSLKRLYCRVRRRLR